MNPLIVVGIFLLVFIGIVIISSLIRKENKEKANKESGEKIVKDMKDSIAEYYKMQESGKYTLEELEAFRLADRKRFMDFIKSGRNGND